MKNDLKPTDFLKCNFHFETEGVINSLGSCGLGPFWPHPFRETWASKMWGSRAQSVSTWRNHNCSVWHASRVNFHASWVNFACHVDHLRAPHGLSSCGPKILMCEEFVCWERHSVWNTAFKKRCGVCRYLRGTNRENSWIAQDMKPLTTINPLLSLGFYVFPSSVVRWDHWACFMKHLRNKMVHTKLKNTFVRLDLLW